MKYIQIIQNDRSKVADASSFLAINDVIMTLLLLLKGQCPDYAHARASSVSSSKDNRTVISTRQDFLPDRTADRDLLFIFSSNILDFQRSLSSYIKIWLAVRTYRDFIASWASSRPENLVPLALKTYFLI